jgi:putative tricarboxylic transport membrane protein
MLAALLEKELGQPVTVVNRTGGGGMLGHTAGATAAPDGAAGGHGGARPDDQSRSVE